MKQPQPRLLRPWLTPKMLLWTRTDFTRGNRRCLREVGLQFPTLSESRTTSWAAVMLLVWMVSQQPRPSGSASPGVSHEADLEVLASLLLPHDILSFHRPLPVQQSPLAGPPLRVCPASVPLWVLFTLVAIASATLLVASTACPPELIILSELAARGGHMATSCGCNIYLSFPLTPFPLLYFSQFPTRNLNSEAAPCSLPAPPLQHIHTPHITPYHWETTPCFSINSSKGI